MFKGISGDKEKGETSIACNYLILQIISTSK